MKVIIIIMQLITIQFAVRVRKDYTPLRVYMGCVWVVIYVKYIIYEGLLHNTLALDVDTVQETCILWAPICGSARSMDRADPQITPNIYSRVRKDYTPLPVCLGCVWVVGMSNIITYEGLLHNTLALDVDTVQEAACRAYTANSRLTHEKALSLCEWFRNLVKRNVVRATPAVVELNSDWLNRFTPNPGLRSRSRKTEVIGKAQ